MGTTFVVLESSDQTKLPEGREKYTPVTADKCQLSPSAVVKQLLLIVLAVVTGIGTGRAIGDEAPGPIPATPGATPALTYEVKALNAGTVEIGWPVLIGIYGPFASELKAAMKTDPETARRNLKLYLDGVPMEGLKAEILPPQAALNLSEKDPKPDYVLRFVLDRDSNNEANRKAWDSLLFRLAVPQLLQTGVGLNGEIPHLSLGQDLKFQVRDPMLIDAVTWIGVFVFVVSMIVVIYFGIVRESGPNSPYSLGKTQMAFWGLLVAISFAAVWIIGHWMERIPDQVLTLIGISGATGLGSVLINKRTPSSSDQKAYPRSAWFRDIISDGTGVSFQRFQVVLWTLILGVVFAFNVANTCSMPEFENTLLVLMGISNGLYLGFKIPETPKSGNSLGSPP
jgi:hypothetical protein